MTDVHVMVTPEETNLVNRIAGRVYKKYCPAGESGQMMIEDLKHYGIIGLIEAKKNYNSSRGVPWLKFAAYRINGAMIDAIRKLPIIRLPQEKQKKIKALASAKQELMKTGENPNPEKLAGKDSIECEQKQ